MISKGVVDAVVQGAILGRGDDEPEYVYGLSEVQPGDGLTKAINRLAQAIEQATLAKLDAPAAVPTAPAPLAALPPVREPYTLPDPNVCPIHKTPWKVVPAGISKKTGNPYEAFKACSTKGCDQRPPR